jgi:hypothetical protein
MTDLIVVASGVSPGRVEAVVPPACRRPVEAPPPPVREGDDLVIALGPWRPRRPACHLLPSLSLLTRAPVAFRFELSALTGATWSPWVATDPVGGDGFPPLPAAAGPLRTDIDVCVASAPADAVRLRVRLRGPAPALRSPWLVALSLAGPEPAAAATAPAGSGVRLTVPAISQMGEDPAIAHRICSPTSVAMVLGALGAPDTAASVARDVYDARLDRYGIWPAAIHAAARRGVLGYLLRFPDWAAAAWCLDHGLPVVASVRYAAGALGGAPMDATDGHLLVVTGYEDGAVLVNDPAAPDAASVARRYRLPEFARAWLEGSAVGYLLFRPEG